MDARRGAGLLIRLLDGSAVATYNPPCNCFFVSVAFVRHLAQDKTRAANKQKRPELSKGKPSMIVQKRPWQERYTDYFYRNQKNWIDGTRQFHEMIQKYLSKDKVVLELGPGIKNRTSSFLRGICAALDGLDVDENAKENPDLRHIYIYGGGDWPIADNSYDAVISDYVFEHIEKPEKITAEAFRVLR